ncbi:MAG: YlbF family regulator [Christensenellales bacterium]
MDYIECAIKLGEALSQSKELLQMREAQLTLQQDIPAMGIVNAIAIKRQDMEKLMIQPDITPEEIQKMSDEIKDLESLARSNDLIQAMIEAQNNFSSVMSQVNAILKYYIADDEGGDSPEDGCKGECSGCQGCH